MLNRPATKIDLCIEEELIEYDEVKQLRIQQPDYIANQEKSSTRPLLTIKDIGLERSVLQSEDGNIDKSGFYSNNPHTNKKEYHLNNILFSSESSAKNGVFQLDNEAQFKTPENK